MKLNWKKGIDWLKVAFAVYLLIAITWIGALVNQPQNDLSLGGDNVLPIAGTSYNLAGAGISSTATSFSLTSFTFPQTGREITDSDMSETFYLTLEPGSRSRQEIISCTTVTQNSDDTATISGCSRGLLPFSPYTASSTYAFSHSGGSTVILSDPPQLFNQTTFKDNDETITGTWLVPTPTAGSQIATKDYVDSTITGTSTISYDKQVIAGNAGETVAACNLVYFDGTDQEWKKVDVDTASTYQDKFIGITRGAGTDGAAITDGIVLKGRVTSCSGLTPGSTYYASSTAGAIDTTSSVQPLGEAEDTNVLYFDPVLIDVAFKGQDNTWTGTNTFTSATTTFDESITGHASTTFTVYTADDTWSKPAGLEYIVVEVIGGGGAGADGVNDSFGGGGGGAGGYAKELLTASELSATSSVSITVGLATETSSFGSFLSATGGSNGSSQNGGAGGTGSGGDLNIGGADGGGGAGDGSSEGTGGSGGSSFYGGGGKGGAGVGVNGAAGNNYGSGGGGGGAADSGGGLEGSGGSGSQGIVIITEHF